MTRCDEGYTLVELLVVILIFSIVMALISVSFNRIVTSSGQLVKSAQTDVGGLIGLELLRRDLEVAGFGLPWSLPVGFTYHEASAKVMVSGCKNGCPGAERSLFNDAGPVQVNPPRAYVLGDNVGYNGSDYLVLKGTALGMSQASRRWSYLTYSSAGELIKPCKSELELAPGQDDKVIVIKSGLRSSEAARELVTESSSGFSLLFNQPLPGEYKPQNKHDIYLVYGVASITDGEDTEDYSKLSFPFNRADYYLSRETNRSSRCAPYTGVLYKTVINHQDKVPSYYPVLDCVADLQVVTRMQSDQQSAVELPLTLARADMTAALVREQLKEIRVYILAQQGKKDPGYRYPVTDPKAAISVGGGTPGKSAGWSGGRVWTQAELDQLGADWRNYRWKVYSLVVQPKNL